MSSAETDVAGKRRRYLDALKRALTRMDGSEVPRGGAARWAFSKLFRNAGWLYLALARRGLIPASVQKRAVDPLVRFMSRFKAFDPIARAEGRDWPRDAETMIGLTRLQNIEDCVTDVLDRAVPGDLIETGVWRGGATIFMAGILRAYGDTVRRVWVADSFEGLPRPDPGRAPADSGDPHYALSGELAVPEEQVRANFARYNLLSDRVRFLRGWFKDTLPNAPIERIAVMRLDGDLYESTMDALEALYPKLSLGGYCIIDDYNALPNCKAAVDDYRLRTGVTEPIVPIDWTGVYWRREPR